MEEIKFRVFDKISKQMHRWSQIASISLVDFEFEHYILMQYTGLKDKNGKEIYEGDILCDYRLDGTFRMFKIFRKKGGFVFNTHSDDFKKPFEQIIFTEACADMQNASFLETCEIEGNVCTHSLE